MLERDYILELVSTFARSVARGFARALGDDPDGGVREVEQAVADLLELDAETALALAPDSLVTMMVLSGTGSALASYVAYALRRLGDVYERRGDDDLAGLRRAQGAAVAESFGCDADAVPDELAGLDRELFA